MPESNASHGYTKVVNSTFERLSWLHVYVQTLARKADGESRRAVRNTHGIMQ